MNDREGRTMKKWTWQLAFGGILLLLSAALYTLHFLIFRDAHHIWIYLLGDIAFIPIQVLLVTLIIEQLLTRREKQTMLGKLNMVIGVFFSETGNELLQRVATFSGTAGELRQVLKARGDWSERDFHQALRLSAAIDPKIDCRQGDLDGLRSFLLANRQNLMRLLENPNLLEHEAFTDVLWGVVHLTEELAARNLAQPLPEADAKHLDGDIRRAYLHTLAAWVEYMRHLKTAYPYLFSLAVRQNPFDPEASVTVR
jgi:hypothetical protein